MATDVDICNLALAHLGDEATVASIDPPEGSAQSEHCARFYSMARDTLLESHTWGFATRRAALAQLASSSAQWDYTYQAPGQALHILGVLAADTSDDYSIAPLVEGANPIVTAAGYAPQPFVVESLEDGTDIILTDLPDAWVRYTVRITDAAKFSPLFVDCLSWLLASMIAGPLIKGDTGAAAGRTCFQTYRMRLAEATASDSNDRQVKPTHVVPWLAGR